MTGIDPAWKRAAFERLKELNDNGRLVPAKRKKFSPKTREAVKAAYDGLCARCEEPLGKVFDLDHIIEHDLMGSDEIDNLVPLHPECHRVKTSARAPVLAHVHRLFKRETEGPRPSRMKSGGKLQSAGFDKRLRKHMNGAVSRRSPA